MKSNNAPDQQDRPNAKSTATNQFPGKTYQIIRDVIAMILGTLTVIAAFLIPLAIDNSSNKSSTITYVNALNNTISPAIYKIFITLGTDKNAFTYETISNDIELERNVFSLLNAYELFAYAILNDVLNEEIALNLKRDALLQTWDRYEKYILEYRKKRASPEAWNQLELLANKIKASKHKL